MILFLDNNNNKNNNNNNNKAACCDLMMGLKFPAMPYMYLL